MSDAPRIRVAAVLRAQGGIVTVVHRKGGQSYHLLPGGGVERGEALGEALVREVREETGLECRPVKPVFLSDTIAPDGSRHVVNVTFLAEVTGGELRVTADDERVVDVRVVDPEELAGLDLRPPIGEALTGFVGGGYADEARYLGRLWTEEGAEERTS